jgi:hypothetical protein
VSDLDRIGLECPDIPTLGQAVVTTEANSGRDVQTDGGYVGMHYGENLVAHQAAS